MRVIFNIHSNEAARVAGWRAKEVKVNDKRKAHLEQVLKAVSLADGDSMYDFIIEKGRLSDKWLLHVNGINVSKSTNLKTEVRDNVQIHLARIVSHLVG